VKEPYRADKKIDVRMVGTTGVLGGGLSVLGIVVIFMVVV